MKLTIAQRDKVRHIIYWQRIYVVDDIIDQSGFSRGAVRSYLKDMEYEIIQCPYCGREIVKVWNNPQKKFCNADHKRLYYNKHRKKTKKSTCRYCGKEYEHYSFRNTGFCSISCAKRYKLEHKNEEK